MCILGRIGCLLESECVFFSCSLIVTPRGGDFVGWFPNQKPGGRGPPLKNNPNFFKQQGLFFGGFLCLRVLGHGLELTQPRNPPGGGSHDQLVKRRQKRRCIGGTDRKRSVARVHTFTERDFVKDSLLDAYTPLIGVRRTWKYFVSRPREKSVYRNLQVWSVCEKECPIRKKKRRAEVMVWCAYGKPNQTQSSNMDSSPGTWHLIRD